MINELRHRLRERIAEIGEKAIEGKLQSRELTKLENLVRLVDYCERLETGNALWHRKHLIVIGSLVLILAVLSFLLFGRMPSTDIELDAQVSEVGFDLTGHRQQLTDDLTPVKLSTPLHKYGDVLGGLL